MLFHITHTHEPTECLFGEPAALEATFGAVNQAMADAGATVIGSWVYAPAHTFYWVVEADSAETLNRGLVPVLDRGHGEIRPIADVAETIAMATRLGES